MSGVGRSLLDHSATLDDPRRSWKVVYPPPEVSLPALFATLAAAQDFVEIWRWGRVSLDFLRRFFCRICEKWPVLVLSVCGRPLGCKKNLL